MFGTVTAAHLVLPWQSWACAGFLLLLGWFSTSGRHEKIALVALALALFSLSALRFTMHAPAPTPGDLRYLPMGGVTVIGYPLAPPVETALGWHATFRLLARATAGEQRSAAGDVYLSGKGLPPAVGHYYRVLGNRRPTEESGNPFGFSWRSYLQERNLTYALRAQLIEPLPGVAPTSPLHAARASLTRRLARTMVGEYDAISVQLLNGLLLGVHGASLPPQLTEQFRRAGTIHLMVVSGSQVALLATFLLFPLLLAPRGRISTTYPVLRGTLLGASLPVLGLYILLADRGPSVDRALLMVLLGILCVFLGFSPLARTRSFRPDGLTLLALAALVITLVNPLLLFGPSMQLSFAAVLGLMVAAPPLIHLFSRVIGRAAFFPATTIGAQLMTAPVLAWHFGAIPLLAPLTNLVAIPLVALLVPLGLLTLVCALTVPALAVALNHVNVLLLHLLLSVSAMAGELPGAEWRWVVRSPWPVLGYFAILSLAISLMSRWTNSHEKEWTIPAGREPRMW